MMALFIHEASTATGIGLIIAIIVSATIVVVSVAGLIWIAIDK